jgi:hypothetical protein
MRLLARQSSGGAWMRSTPRMPICPAHNFTVGRLKGFAFRRPLTINRAIGLANIAMMPSTLFYGSIFLPGSKEKSDENA